MKTGESSKAKGGINFLGLLAIVFITLKLTNFIDWSWWLVTAPLWGCAALSFLIICIAFVFAMFTKE